MKLTVGFSAPGENQIFIESEEGMCGKALLVDLATKRWWHENKF